MLHCLINIIYLFIFIERVTTVRSAQSGRGGRSETVIVPQPVASRDVVQRRVAARIIPGHVRVRRQRTRPLHTQHKESEVNVDAVLQLPSAKTGALHAACLIRAVQAVNWSLTEKESGVGKFWGVLFQTITGQRAQARQP